MTVAIVILDGILCVMMGINLWLGWREKKK